MTDFEILKIRVEEIVKNPAKSKQILLAFHSFLIRTDENKNIIKQYQDGTTDKKST